MVPSHGALGGLAEGHGRKADFPLLTLSEFSADLGGILKRRDLINIQTATAQNESFKGKSTSKAYERSNFTMVKFQLPIKLENKGKRKKIT